jgi:hypothetical protein
MRAPNPPEPEHVTDGTPCWCYPKTRTFGDTVIVVHRTLREVMEVLPCCYVGCGEPATLIGVFGPHPEDYTHGCYKHIYSLIDGDAPSESVWIGPIEYDQDYRNH